MFFEVRKMLKYSTGERLKQIMSERHLRQTDIIKMCEPLCKQFKVRLGKNDLSQYISGKVEPRQNKLYVLAYTLNVNEAWLMGYDVSPERHEEDFSMPDNTKPISTKRFPMLGEIACGKPIMAEQEYETYIEASSNINADFCLIAKGDSMINARIFDGDVVFIKEQPIVENGEIAAVIIDNEATLKRVYIKSDRIILRPENPVYDDIVYEKEEMNNVRILGKAVAFTSYVK
jgi:repressor LexA